MPSYPALNDRFPICEAFLATVNSATFPLEGSGITVQAEHASRKTSHGKKITVRCKLGRKKPGRKTGKSGSKNGDDDICPFRIVAERDDASTSTGLGDFVVIEYLTHTTPLHERCRFLGADGDPDPAASEETPSEASRSRDARGKFVARTRPPGIMKEVYAGQPVFVPEEPTVVDNTLYLRSGFAIPLLPSKRDSSRSAERIRPKRRSQSSLSHENDAKWHAWEVRTSGEGEWPVKRQRLTGAGGADAMRAWGWVRGPDEKAVETDEPESAAIVVHGDDERAGTGVEFSLHGEAENAAVEAEEHAQAAKAQLPEHGSSSQREAARFRDFWSRPDIIHLDAPALSTKPNQQPQTPFPPRSRDLSQSDEIDALSEAISLSFSFSLPHETPETSFSPTSPTLLRRREPQVVKSNLPATDAAPAEHQPPPTLITIKREELEDAREQLALEALLGLSGLLVGEDSTSIPASKNEEDRRSQADTNPVQDTSATVVDDAVHHDIEQKVKDLPQDRREATPPPRKRSPRKLSRWELPEPVEAEILVVSEPTSAARDNREDEEKKLFDEAALLIRSSPSEPPSKPAALAFVPRSSKKPVASSRTTFKRQAYHADSVGASFSGQQNALMAVAQASKAKREADLLERARAEQFAAVVKAENEATEEEKLAAAVAKEQRQAEDLKHLLWKSGGQNEGGKIDRLYSAAALEHRIASLAQKAPTFCPSHELSAATTPVYLDLLSGLCRPARYRLPSLPAFPPRRIDPMSLSTASHDSKSLAGQLVAQSIQPDKRQLLALEYLYGRAVGVDECAHLEKHEPAMGRLVRVMAAVAEINEWYRRVEQTAGARNRSTAGEADRDWEIGARRM